MSKCGTEKTHCCWLGRAGECPFVVSVFKDEFIWACSLRVKYGSWEAVHKSSEYVEKIKPIWVSIGMKEDCGSWPKVGEVCPECGEIG